MAENETEGGADTNEVGAQPKGKLKLIVIIVAVLALLGGGAATYFFFFRHHDEGEQHAEAVKVKPPVFIDVPDMLVNLVGQPGERVQYLKVKLVLELKEELTRRVNNAVAPVKVSAVLFKEIVVQ